MSWVISEVWEVSWVISEVWGMSWVISEVWGCPASSVRCGDVLGSWESSGGQPCSVPKDWTMAVRGDSRVAGQRQS